MSEFRSIEFPGGIDPSRITSEGETRFVIRHVLIEKGHAIATNGRTLICAAVRDTRPKDGSIALTSEAVSAACKPSDRNMRTEIGELRLDADKQQAFVETRWPEGEIRFKQPDQSTAAEYPNWSQVVPDNPAGRFRIGINARLLLRLAKAMGSRDGTAFLHIDINQPGGAMLVTVDPSPHAFGIIMPVVDRGNSKPPKLEDNEALKHAYRVARQRALAKDGWQDMDSAPADASRFRAIMADGTIHQDVHWACNLSGEEQPPFRGWFVPSGSGFSQIDTPAGWQPITA